MGDYHESFNKFSRNDDSSCWLLKLPRVFDFYKSKTLAITMYFLLIVSRDDRQ